MKTDRAICIILFRADNYVVVKVGLYHRPNQINEMNDSQKGRCFESPLK